MESLDLNSPKKKEEPLGEGIADEKSSFSSADDFYSGNNIEFEKPKTTATETTFSEPKISNANTYSDSDYSNYSSAKPSSIYDSSTEFQVLGRLEKIDKSIHTSVWILIILGILLTVTSVILTVLGMMNAFTAVGVFIDICVYMGLAFGIERKSKGCALAAVIYSCLALAAGFLSSGVRGIALKIAIIAAYINTFQKLREFYQLKAKYEFDPDEKIRSYFEKEPMTFKMRYIIMITCVLLGLGVAVGGVSDFSSDIFSGVSEIVKTQDMDNWQRVKILDGNNVSLLMPTEPTKTEKGDGVVYKSNSVDANITVIAGRDIAKGYTDVQRDAVLDKYDELFSKEEYIEIYSDKGEDDLGKYIYKVVKDKEGKVIVCIKTIIVDDNVDVIMYGYKGKDYSGKNKDNAEEFFSKIYRTY